MPISKQSFPRILRTLGVDSSLINQIKGEDNSPYIIASRADFPQSNDINHSFKVFKNIRDVLKMIPESKININAEDYLLLFYASLLHDISKSGSPEVKKDINGLKSSVKCCKLTVDHGVVSAHYIKLKYDKGYIKFYGLKNEDVRKLLDIISFHNSGIIHTCFLPDEKLNLKELFLCLVFWLADVVEGTCDRALAAQLVNDSVRSPKSNARLGVDKVSIDKDKNIVVWRVNRITRELEQALDMSNSEISKHRLLLQAFGLPDRIICLKKHERILKEKEFLNHNNLISANLCLDVSRMNTPLVLSGSTLPELYDKVTEAFCKISVTEGLTSENYFGPVILEVRDVKNDEEDKIWVRSETGKNYAQVKDYTRKWLDDTLEAGKDFYFGYTHGRRIYNYFYPSRIEDLDPLLGATAKTEEIKDKKLREAFNNLMREREDNGIKGINQFQHVVDILKEEKKGEARRAYVIIPHLMIDNPTSDFFIREEMAPALIAIQFMIERGNKLSGFALLRAQELSTFFVVNYFEIKELINRIIGELKGGIPDVEPGRIIMLSAIGYFEPSTPLLDKPEICKICNKEPAKFKQYAHNLGKEENRKKFIDELLKDYKRPYIKIDTEWCEPFKGFMETGPIEEKEKNKIIEAIDNLKENLGKLEKKRSEKGHSITTEIREEKEKAVDGFIETIKGVFKNNV